MACIRPQDGRVVSGTALRPQYLGMRGFASHSCQSFRLLRMYVFLQDDEIAKATKKIFLLEQSSLSQVE